MNSETQAKFLSQAILSAAKKSVKDAKARNVQPDPSATVIAPRYRVEKQPDPSATVIAPRYKTGK